jgi:hypothetical protein
MSIRRKSADSGTRPHAASSMQRAAASTRRHAIAWSLISVWPERPDAVRQGSYAASGWPGPSLVAQVRCRFPYLRSKAVTAFSRIVTCLLLVLEALIVAW